MEDLEYRPGGSQQDQFSLLNQQTQQKIETQVQNKEVNQNQNQIIKIIKPQNCEEEDFFYGIDKKIYQKNQDPKQQIQIKTGTDFQLLPQNPQFLQECDPFEPLYVPKQDVLENALRREIEKFCFSDTLMNRIVYDCVDVSVYTKDLEPSLYGIDVLPFYIPTSLDDNTLVFESKFECGNLRRAIQISEFEYNLILKPDYFTQGNTQWYYFSFANTRKNQEYRFNIINMMKPDSLYNAGMKPLVYSQQQAKLSQTGWYRDGYDICYYQNNMKRKSGGYYYTLTFSVKFQCIYYYKIIITIFTTDNYDQIYLSHCYPYTYTQLCQLKFVFNRYLNRIERDPFRQHKLKRKILCQTISGNDVPVITITDQDSNCNKKAIVLTSRIHPGESMSSYVIEYFIDFLTGQSMEAKTLRENFVFKVVPMLNIDGVINGNYRCNLAGVDLNRQWIYPQKSQHPTIYYSKMLIKKMKEEKNLVFFCDLHGHSRKKNIFMYGCSGKDPNRKEMVFPLLMRNNCSVLSFKDCNFAIQKEREGCARITIWKEFFINNCFTLEMSFCGTDYGKYEYFHFNFEIFKEIAKSFCLSLIDCFEPDQIKVKSVLEEIEQIIMKSLNDKNKVADSSEGMDSDYSNDEDISKKNEKENSNNNNQQSPNQQEENAQINSQNGKNGQQEKIQQQVLNQDQKKTQKVIKKIIPQQILPKKKK